MISMDSTLRSNISVGLPLDLLVYEADSLRVSKFVLIDENNEYMQMIRRTWGERLRQVFEEIPTPAWRGSEEAHGSFDTGKGTPAMAPLPETMETSSRASTVQLVAGSAAGVVKPPGS
jgi:putative proteasome-type protease